MENERLSSAALIDDIREAIKKNENWMAYNTASYFLEQNDVYFFSTEDEATEFSMDNISEYDSFKVIKISSLEDVIQQIPSANLFNSHLNSEISKLIQYTILENTADKNAKNVNDLKRLSNSYLSQTKTFFMNEKNYEYLTEQLKRTGFEDTLNEELQKNMEKQNPEFTLNMQKDYGTDNVKAALHFKKSDESNMFFFNRYEMELKKENGNTAKQTFYPDKNITLKEGYNLLDGRAVHKTLTSKEHEKYTAWLQLDFKNTTQSGNNQFKQYHQNYGFDLEQTLSKYPIKELQNEKFKESLIRSLERGNLQSATFLINRKEEKIFLTPNVAFKALSAFDDKMQKIKLSDLLENQKKQQSSKQENRQELSEKQTAKQETKISVDKEKPVQKKSKRQKISA